VKVAVLLLQSMIVRFCLSVLVIYGVLSHGMCCKKFFHSVIKCTQRYL